MDCERTRAHLSEWVDGRVVGTTRAELKEHLRSCGACREEERILRGTWVLLGHYPSIEPSAGFLRGIQARLRRPLLWKIVAPLAAAAAAVVISVVVFVSPPATVTEPPVTEEERELVENLDLLEDYELVSALEMMADESVAGPNAHLFKEDRR